MKNKLIKTAMVSALFGAMVTINSCNKNGLDVPLTGDTEESLESPEQIFKVVASAYGKMNELYNPAGHRAASFPAIHEFFYVMGDDITQIDISNYEHFGGITASDGSVAYFYKQLYLMNGRANFAIDIVEKKASVYAGNTALKNTHMGEAKFLRGYTHWLLWNYYGTAPVVTKRYNSIDETFEAGNSTGTELLDAAIADFKEAADLLPDSYGANFRGRITKNAANAFLGKALVFKGSATNNAGAYTEALTALNKVTATLSANVMDNFSFKHENNSESLFEFQATLSAADNLWIPNDLVGANNNGAACTTWNFYELEPGTSGWIFNGEQGKMRPTQKLLSLFEANDPRRTAFTDNSDPTKPRFRKYVTENQLIPGREGCSVNNPRIMRYADVLLLKAEATLKSGGSKAAAIGFLNEVRTRARGAGTSPANRNTGEGSDAVVMQWIMDERMMELCGEDSQRWFDLRRWHLGNTITLNAAFFNSINSTANSFAVPKNLNLPIPNDEIIINPKLVQNPGY
jgi:starch-binding outer membrane protein, SusD/RagB family